MSVAESIPLNQFKEHFGDKTGMRPLGNPSLHNQLMTFRAIKRGHRRSSPCSIRRVLRSRFPLAVSGGVWSRHQREI